MTTTKFLALRLDGSTTTHASKSALDRARRRASGQRTIVDSWPETSPPPRVGASATEWDDYRARRGYAGGR